VLTELRIQSTAAVAVLTKLADMDPFGDDAHPDPAQHYRISDRCRDDDVIFNSAI
jgi:hypothetical protein